MTNKLLPARKYRVFFLLICGTGLYFFANLQRVAIPGTVFDQLQGNLHASAPYITALGASFTTELWLSLGVICAFAIAFFSLNIYLIKNRRV